MEIEIGKLNYTLCIICQCSKKNKKTVSKPKSYERFIEYVKAHCVLNSLKYKHLKDVDLCDEYLRYHGVKWHRQCYSDLTNKEKVERLKKSKLMESHNQVTTSKTGTRSKVESTLSKEKCLFCDKTQAAKEHSTSRESLTITVCSPDSDVFFLLLKYYDDLSCHITFQTGSGSKRRDITVSSVVSALSKVQREALLAMHALSGCDTTGGFSKKGNHTSAKLCLPKFITRFL